VGVGVAADGGTLMPTHSGKYRQEDSLKSNYFGTFLDTMRKKEEVGGFEATLHALLDNGVKVVVVAKEKGKLVVKEARG
jgi:hypothetical protein